MADGGVDRCAVVRGIVGPSGSCGHHSTAAATPARPECRRDRTCNSCTTDVPRSYYLHGFRGFISSSVNLSEWSSLAIRISREYIRLVACKRRWSKGSAIDGSTAMNRECHIFKESMAWAIATILVVACFVAFRISSPWVAVHESQAIASPSNDPCIPSP